MENIQQRIIKGVSIFKDNLLLFLGICLLSSVLSIYAVPFLVSGSLSEQEINEGINQVGMTYGATIPFSANEIVSSIVSLFKLLIVSTISVIIAYIVKYKIDKKIFRINRWRDWKFFIYVSGISLLMVDFFQKITSNNEDNFILNLFSTTLFAFIIIIFSAIILPEELPEIKM